MKQHKHTETVALLFVVSEKEKEKKNNKNKNNLWDTGLPGILNLVLFIFSSLCFVHFLIFLFYFKYVFWSSALSASRCQTDEPATYAQAAAKADTANAADTVVKPFAPSTFSSSSAEQGTTASGLARPQTPDATVGLEELQKNGMAAQEAQEAQFRTDGCV